MEIGIIIKNKNNKTNKNTYTYKNYMKTYIIHIIFMPSDTNQ